MRRSEYFIGGEDINTLTAGHAMQSKVRFCHLDHRWRDITMAIVNHSFSALPVVDSEKKLLGIVSESDLLHCILQGSDEQTLKARDMMNKEVVTVNEDTPLKDVIKTLEDNKLVRVPVVKDNVLVGIITRRDLLICHMKASGEPPHWI